LLKHSDQWFHALCSAQYNDKKKTIPCTLMYPISIWMRL